MVDELFNYRNRNIVNPLLKAVKGFLSAELTVFKAHYSLKLRRYAKIKATSTKGGYMNSSIIGIKNAVNPLLKAAKGFLSAELAVFSRKFC